MHIDTVQLKDSVTIAHIQLNSAMCESINQCAVVCIKLRFFNILAKMLSLSSSHECNSSMDSAQRQYVTRPVKTGHIYTKICLIF